MGWGRLNLYHEFLGTPTTSFSSAAGPVPFTADLQVEALDRLSRDMEDLAHIHKRMTFLGIEMRAVHEGVANSVLVGLRGLVGQMFREDNVHKIRRGLSAKVRAGQSAGGKAYGYRPDPSNKGGLLIVEHEASIIREVYRRYAEGASPRQIAHDLNHRNVPPPRGKVWNASALHGNPKRAYGILRNSLYRGTLVWNRTRMVKDPDTGKRLIRVNPQSEWHEREVPELCIVSPELFDRVQEKAVRGYKAREMNQARRPKRLLSGLLKCGACGAGMAMNGIDKSGRVRLRCTAHSQSGTCPDPRTYYLDTVEKLTLDTLLKNLRDPRLLMVYVKEYHAERMRLAKSAHKRRYEIERRLGVVEREAARLVKLYSSGRVELDFVTQPLRDFKVEKDALVAELDDLPVEVQVVTLHPAALKRYEEQLSDLALAMRKGSVGGDQPGALGLRDLVETVTIYPTDKRGGVAVKINGTLNAMLGVPQSIIDSVYKDGSGGGI